MKDYKNLLSKVILFFLVLCGVFGIFGIINRRYSSQTVELKEVERKPKYIRELQKQTEPVEMSEPAEVTKTEAEVQAEQEELQMQIEYEEKAPEWVSLGIFKTTAYCPCAKCCGKSNGITASGTVATAGRTIAADTSILPFGTQVNINGKLYTVEDTGGGIKGKRIDIFFATHQEAIEYGVGSVEVYILK